MKIQIGSLAALTLGLIACATAPALVLIENTRAIANTKDHVWANLVEHFASNISMKTIEKDSGIIYAERMFGGGNSVAGMADCGVDPMARPITTAADLNVFVREAPAGGVTATVNARYRQTRQSAWDNSMTSVDCASLGTMERTILDAAAR